MFKLLTFFYIFSIPVIKNISFINTTILVGILFGIKIFINKKYLNTLKKILSQRSVFKVYVGLILIILISIAIPTFHSTYDFSLVKTLINQFICITIGIMLFGYYKEKNKQENIIDDIVTAFIIQSLIQLICLISPSINSILNYFRSDNTILIMQKYSGIRGLSISGSSFFGLAIGYGVAYVLFFTNYIKNKEMGKINKIISFLLLLFGGASAGRTSLIGIILGINLFIYDKIKYDGGSIKYKRFIKISPKKIVFNILLVIFMICGIKYLQINQNKLQINSINQKVHYFLNYSLEFLNNFLEKGDFTTTSTSKLFNNMYFKIPLRTYLLGDGYYTNIDGSYYMYTDAGYMRNLLYGGIMWLIFLFCYQILFFSWKKRYLIFNLAITLMILIFHIKGDVIGFSIMLQSIFILILMNQNSKCRGVLVE